MKKSDVFWGAMVSGALIGAGIGALFALEQSGWKLVNEQTTPLLVPTGACAMLGSGVGGIIGWFSSLFCE